MCPSLEILFSSQYFNQLSDRSEINITGIWLMVLINDLKAKLFRKR